jgi:hypothetical protein
MILHALFPAFQAKEVRCSRAYLLVQPKDPGYSGRVSGELSIRIPTVHI